MSTMETSFFPQKGIANKELRETPLIISGSGISGLISACALAQKGVRVVILEKEESVQVTGAGLQLSPNAVACLAFLGLVDVIKESTITPKTLYLYCKNTGKELRGIPLGRSFHERYGAWYWLIHRKDLYKALLDKARSYPEVEIIFGTSVTDATCDSTGVSVEFQTKNGLAIQRGCALIGADGTHSKVRRNILDLPPPKLTGHTAYRCLIPHDLLPKEDIIPHLYDATHLWMGTGCHLVHYPVKPQKALNVVVIMAEKWLEDKNYVTVESAKFMPLVMGWTPPLQKLLSCAPSWWKTPLSMMELGKIWTEERVGLVGDAAHTMVPCAAQGAAMALEDGICLAHALTTAETVQDGLAQFEKQRKPRVERVALASLYSLRLYHTNYFLSLFRNFFIQKTSEDWLLRRYHWIYEWSPEKALL